MKGRSGSEGTLKASNPNWDNTFLDQLAAEDLDAIDEYTNDSIQELGGQSGPAVSPPDTPALIRQDGSIGPRAKGLGPLQRNHRRKSR